MFFKKFKNLLFLYWSAFFLIFFSPIVVDLSIADVKTDAEKITVVMDNNYPPYAFLDKNGNLQGILIDLWKLWEQKTGIKVELSAFDLNEALERMKAGEFDVIDTIFFTEQRAKFLDYSKPYEKIDTSIFFYKDISGISDVHSLHGFVIGVKSGDAAIDYLRKNDINDLKEYPSYESIIEDAKNNKIMVFVIDKPPALYYLYKKGIIDQFKYSDPLYTGKLHRAVKKGDKQLLKLIEEGFSKVSDREYKNIYRKWYGTPSVSISAYFKYFIIAVVFISLILSLLSIWNYSLRKKVKERTIQLEKQIAENIEKTNQISLSEKRYRSIFENAVEGIVQTDNEGNIITANTAFANMLGYDSPSNIYGLNIRNFYANPNEIEKIIDLLKNENYLKGVETKLLKKENSEISVNLSISTIKDDKGNIISFIFIIEDVTEKKEKEKEIKMLREHYYQSQKMESLGTLTGGIAHDFNNFLTAIKGFATLAKMRIKNDVYVEQYLDNIITTSNRMAEIISSLLAFSRKQPIQLKPVDLTKEITKAESLIRKVLTEKIEIKIYKTEKELTVLADETQLIQILLNLASNARDAMPDGGIFTISIEDYYIGDEFIKKYGFGKKGNYALLKVSDTGTGMDKNTLTKIFEPFFTTKEQGKGTGLGLSMVYGIVKRHNGLINVDSSPGKGTIFNIFLPLTESTNLREGISKHDDHIKKIKSQLFNETVLIAEDNDDVRLYLKEILKSQGFKVIEAKDGEELINTYKGEKNIALIISDCIMPKKSGIDAYFTIREFDKNIKFIFISGYDRELLSKLPLDDTKIKFIPKPITPEILIENIERILES